MRGAAALSLFLLLLELPSSSCHGQITWPPSTRHGGNVHAAADCARGECFYFSNNVEISGSETLPTSMRSMEPDVEGGRYDVWRTHPWRAPGTAPVYGSGCGVAGGHPTLSYANGGVPPPGISQGLDGAFLPKVGSTMGPAVWRKGSTVEVAWAMSANHAGGYAYRVCRFGGDTQGGSTPVTEACFQKNQLRFAENASYALFPNGTRVSIPNRILVPGRSLDGYPQTAEWKRVPVPTCRECDRAYDMCGSPLLPTPGLDYGSAWNRQINCYAACAGSVTSKNAQGSCPNRTQFVTSAGSDANAGTDGDSEPNNSAFSGYGKSIWEWSVLDKVEVPADLEEGTYVLSWRWDCEQSAQVWQSCADIEVVAEDGDSAWDVASLGAMERVPKVKRGGTGLSTNEKCAALMELCRGEEGEISFECGDDQIEATCVEVNTNDAGRALSVKWPIVAVWVVVGIVI